MLWITLLHIIITNIYIYHIHLQSTNIYQLLLLSKWDQNFYISLHLYIQYTLNDALFVNKHLFLNDLELKYFFLKLWIRNGSCNGMPCFKQSRVLRVYSLQSCISGQSWTTAGSHQETAQYKNWSFVFETVRPHDFSNILTH